MNSLPPILNRDFRLPDDGKVHLVPKGNYPVVHEDKRIVQVVDDAALAAMVNNLRADAATLNFGGLCIDFDHHRHDPDKPSRAGGWQDENVEVRSDGIYGAPRLSSSGKAAVEGGDFRYISPEFDPATLQHLGGNKYRPTRLVGFGLTNNPNMRGMTPLSNRRVGASEGQPNPADENKHTSNMKTVTSLLGLADGADETQITGAISALRNKAAEVPTLTNRIQTLEDERTVLIGESVDADIAAHGITDAATIAKLKPVLLGPTLKNRTERVEFIALFPKPAATAAAAAPGKKALTNRAEAKTPTASATDDPEAEKTEDVKRANVITNRARAMMATNKTLTLTAAYQRAAHEVDCEAAAAK